jgi:hypothetical protein
MKKILEFWFPPIIWAILIFSFSSKSVPTTSEVYWQDFVIKKTAHIIEYAIFSVLIYRGFINSGVNQKQARLYSVLLAIIYALTDEFHQSFTPGRQPRIRDVIIDTIGAGLGIYSLWKLLPKAPLKLKNWAKKLQLI